MKKFYILFFLIGLIFFTGCKYQSITNFYVTDVFDIQENKKPLELESIIKIEVPSKDTFIENKDAIAGIITPFFDLKSELFCEENGMTTFAVAKVKLPLIYEKGQPPGRKFMYFVVRDKQNTGSLGMATAVSVLFNKAQYAKFQDLVESQFYNRIDPEEFTLNIVLHNDQKTPIDVILISSYVDGQPVPFSKTVKLNRRNSVDVVLSKIYMNAAIKNEAADLFYIRHQKSG